MSNQVCYLKNKECKKIHFTNHKTFKKVLFKALKICWIKKLRIAMSRFKVFHIQQYCRRDKI